MNPETNDLKDIRMLITNYSKVAIAGHVNPDGDAISSCLGLALCLKKIGIEPVVILEEYSHKFDIIPGKEFIYNGDLESLDIDAMICLDCGSLDRLGNAVKLFEKTPVTFNIDHHVSNTRYAKHNCVNGNASSTAEVVFDIMNNLVPIDEDIASALYAGIVYDTGGFRHKSTSADTHIAVSKLMWLDIPFSKIYNTIMFDRTMAVAKSFGKSLGNLQSEGSVYYTYITAEETASVGATVKDLDGTVDYIISISDAEVAVFFYELPDNQVKASMRSKTVDVSKIAGMFGGGGHVQASGCTLAGDVKSAIATVLPEIKRAVEEYEKKL